VAAFCFNAHLFVWKGWTVSSVVRALSGQLKKNTASVMYGVFKKVALLILFEIFSFLLKFLCEILHICWQFISTYIYQFL